MTIASLLVAGALTAAACSDSDDTATEASEEATTSTAETEVEPETAEESEPDADADADTDSDAEDDGDSEASEEAAPPDLTDDVAALVVRRVTGDLDEFTSTRDAYVADLEAQAGIGTDREFQPFLSFVTFAEPDPPVYIGLTQGDSLGEFSAGAEAVDPDLQTAYFPTFEIEAFDLLTPLTPGTPVDISQIATEPGQVLEVAWRDLSTYTDFDDAAYAEARDGYLEALAAKDGWVAEYQWVSATGGDLVVGMTVYENAEAFQTIATDAEFTASDVYTAFIGAYPIAGGYASSVIK